jgi:hypothetical protein
VWKRKKIIFLDAETQKKPGLSARRAKPHDYYGDKFFYPQLHGVYQISAS